MTRAATRETELAKELEEERKLSSSLRSKLKKARSDKKERDKSFPDGSFVRLHSTMREDNSTNEQHSTLMASMSNLSFASLQVPECKPDDDEEDIDRKTYEKWKDLLQASMHLAGVSDEITKINIFKIKAGSKLMDILEGTASSSDAPDARTAPYSNAIHRLDAFFGSRDYLFMQRQKLRSLTQRANETDYKYVKRVVAVAKLCDFDESSLLEHVADAIQGHATNIKVRETARKFLRKGGQLGELLDEVKALEMDQMNEEIYKRNHQQALQQMEVAAVAGGKPRNEYFNNNRLGNQRNDQRFGGNWKADRGRGGKRYVRQDHVKETKSQQAKCWRCLSFKHPADACWAIKQSCYKCNRTGHAARACHQGSSGSMKRHISGEVNEGASTSKRVAIVKHDEDDAVNDGVSSPSSA